MNEALSKTTKDQRFSKRIGLFVLGCNALFLAFCIGTEINIVFTLLNILLFNYAAWRLHAYKLHALNIKQTQLDLILEAAPIGIFYEYENDKHTNNQMFELLGAPPKEALANLQEDEEGNNPNQKASPNNIKHFKKSIVRDDGTIRELEIWGNSKQLANNSEFRVFIASDRTSNSAVNDKVPSLQEEQMRFILETAPVGFSWYSEHKDSKGKKIVQRYVNQAHLDITGLTREESKKVENYQKITHPEDLIRQKEVTSSITKKKATAVTMEKRYIRKSGKTIWVRSTWTRKWTSDGNGFEGVGTITDITAFKETSIALSEKESQLRFIFENCPIGLLWTDTEIKGPSKKPIFTERLINPAHMAITGLSFEKSGQRGSFGKITHPDDLPIQHKGVEENLSKGDGSFSMEKRYIRDSGDIIHVAISWLRKWNADKSQYQEISSVVDISERKRISGEIALARIEAEQANNSKSQFLSTMSHEIRTPMNGLIGVLHIMESIPPEENAKYLQLAHSSAKTLMALINDILDFSKIEADKIEFEKRHFPIDTLIENVAQKYAPEASDKNLELYCTCSPEAARLLYGDEHRVQQVLSNLMSNAIKFTATGAVEIGARCSKDSTYVEFFVKDSGIGIADTSDQKLFEAFTQVNASSTRQYEGTGLGLSICKSITDRMNAEIGYESVLGEGSTFWVRISTTGSRPLDSLLISPPEIFPKQALLIESNPSYAEHLRLWLRQWKCDVTHISDPQKGSEYNCALIDGKDFDIVLTNPTNNSFFSNQGLYEKTPLKDAKIFLLDRLTESHIDLPSTKVYSSIKAPLSLNELKKAIDNATTPLKPDTDTTADLSDYTVLLVDDNPINRLVSSKLLAQRHNISAESVNDGLEALQALRTQKYDLILMDCMMPNMDGYEATQAIREGEGGKQNKEVTIIALTANANALEEDREKFLSSGMDDYISKPIQPHSIKRALEAWLERTS